MTSTIPNSIPSNNSQSISKTSAWHQRSTASDAWRWRTQISNWHAARVTNAATEAANNLAKRVKRAAFGFTNFNNYRIRVLLYAGKPNWTLLDTLTPT